MASSCLTPSAWTNSLHEPVGVGFRPQTGGAEAKTMRSWDVGGFGAVLRADGGGGVLPAMPVTGCASGLVEREGGRGKVRCMTAVGNPHRLRGLVASIERGLGRMIASPTGRLRAMRLELERQDSAQRHRVEARSKEYRETMGLAANYLRKLN